MKISDAFINALLADATYALGSGITDGTTGSDLEGVLRIRMTPALSCLFFPFGSAAGAWEAAEKAGRAV